MAIYYENGLWLGLFRDDFREEDLKVEEQQIQTECKYCGCNEVLISSEAFVYFRCGTAYWPGTSQWAYANKCVETRVKKLEKRVKRAVEVLEGARRYDFIASCMPHMDRRSDGEFVEYEQAERAIEILRGNSPKSSNSSPITTDDLAASDYYEAVRQRVPWMTAVEHIDGLVEGYRQCGVAVWQAVEHIQRIYGGGNGKAD